MKFHSINYSNLNKKVIIIIPNIKLKIKDELSYE